MTTVVEELSGRVALVTGASRGIGLAIARDLARLGLCVVGTARASAGLDQLGAELRDAPTPGFVVPADLRDAAEVARLFTALDARAGRIDILVNNAGIARSEPFLETTVATWRDVLATNLDAVFLTTQPAVQRMLAQRSGQVIFIASDAAVRGIARMAPYCASKHAVLGFARALAVEFHGSGIRFTTIMPGPVNTTILAERADRFDLPQPEDVAATVRSVVTLPPRCEVRELLVVPTWR